LECMGAMHSKLIPRPSSLQSEAHKSLTVAVRQRTIKRARIAEFVTQEDPEKAKQARIRNKQDLYRANARKNDSSRSYSGRRPGMNRRYLEEDQDDGHYDNSDLSALKRHDGMDYGVDVDSEEEEEQQSWARSKLDRKKQQAAARARRNRFQEEEEEEEEEEGNDDGEEEFAVGQESDEEEEAITTKKSGAKKRTHTAFMDDEEDE